MKFTDLMNWFDDLRLNKTYSEYKNYTVSCNRIFNNPIIFIKDSNGKIIESINLKKRGD